jgi:glyoxylase-like metal-dependent hydrolase (beta-lactamase superfamily II)
MQIQIQPMGAYQTNCYILTIDNKDFIIDPGVDATSWVLNHTKNPVAILNTHGHFDHVWSNAELKQRLNIPIYCPKDDAFMLENDPFAQGTPSSKADYLVDGNKELTFDNIKIKYRHFPGHTPGCSIIEYGNVWFSGDFLFQQSIGRWDFPYSSAKDMIKSLKKAMQIKQNYTIYPGHGNPTTLADEQRVISFWIEQVSSTR